MEFSGVVSRRLPCFSGAGIDAQASKPSFFGSSREIRHLGHRDFGVSFGPRRIPAAMKTEFSDQGHIRYYEKVGQSQTPRCGGKKKKEKVKEKASGGLSTKKKLELLKALSMSNNLNNIADMDNQALGNLVSEAADVLLKELEQFRTEAKELEIRRKQEKAELKAARSATMIDSESSSSSESSESSDSECGEVVDMNQLRSEPVSQLVQDHNLQRGVPQEAAKLPMSLPISLTSNSAVELNRKQECECGDPRASTSCGTSTSSVVEHVNVGGLGSMRVEVCMGNKCKKSGGAVLMQEFERVMSVEGAVVGCKCMGKCRSGPNVRVLNSVADNESIRTATNPLCIGVGLEDVSLIVANLLGEETKGLGLVPAV